MDTITRKAYAKINLGLDVIRRREDGYHEVKMIMQSVNLYDTLAFCKTNKPGITLVTNKEELPGDKNNLIYKAAKLLMDTYHIEEGVHIVLEKRIPMAAGMAGGSTDAAAVFHGINELFSLGLSVNELCGLAVKIGADVPYCIQGGTALAEGIGEKLRQISGMPNCFLLIAKPDIAVSTKYVYENLHANHLTNHPDIDGMIMALEIGNLDGIVSRMDNVLETVTAKKYPEVDKIKGFMGRNGAIGALMSGSGPTVFGIYLTKTKAEEAKKSLIKEGLAKEIYVTVPVNNVM